jgi:hypothetical protein
MSQGHIWGVNGVEIDLSGDESVHKFNQFNQFNTHAQPGRVSFRSSGAKSTFEFGRGSIYGHSGASVTMTGTESQLITSERTAFNTYVGAGVRIAVGNNRSEGTIKMNQVQFGGARGAGGGGGQRGRQGRQPEPDRVHAGLRDRHDRHRRDHRVRPRGHDDREGQFTPAAQGTGHDQGPGACLAENDVISASAQLLCH